MSLPGFTAEASLYKAKAQYKLYYDYNYQNSEIIKPAQLNLRYLICLIECEFRCNPYLGGGYCLVPCPKQCAQKM